MFAAESCHVPFTRGIGRVVAREDRSSRPGLCLISASELGHVSLWRALCTSLLLVHPPPNRICSRLSERLLQRSTPVALSSGGK